MISELNEMGNENSPKNLKLFVFFDIDKDYELLIRLNENSKENSLRIQNEQILDLKYDKVHVFNLPIVDSLLDKNLVKFELRINNKEVMESNILYFLKNENNSYHFIFTLYFTNESSILDHKNNEGSSIFFFFKHLIKMIEINSNETLNIFQEFLKIFDKLDCDNYSYNLMKLLDDFILENKTENILVHLMIICLYESSLDNREEFKMKNLTLLVNKISHVSRENLELFDEENLKKVLIKGIINLINISIQNGNSDWLILVENQNLNEYFNLFDYFIDLLKRNSFQINQKSQFNKIKIYLLKNFELQVENKSFSNDSMIRIISSLSLYKENFINSLEDLIRINLIKFNSIQTIKDEMRRKRWESNSEENITNHINKLFLLNKLIENNIQLKSVTKEFNNLIYELTPSIKYLILIIKSLGKNLDVILARNSLNYIKFTLEDFKFLVDEIHQIDKEIRNELFDIYFYEKLKDTLCEICISSTTDVQKEILSSILLCQDLFPNGSIKFINGFINTKFNLKDYEFLINQLIIPQTHYDVDLTNEFFYFVTKNIIFIHKNNTIGMINDFDFILKLIDNSLFFKTSICEYFWNELNTKFSIEVLLSLTRIFSSEHKYDKLIKISYSNFISNSIVSFTNDFTKINSIFSELSDNCNNLIIDDEETIFMINSLLDILDKNLQPELCIQDFIFINPSNDNFWFKLLNSTNSFINKISQHSYVNKIKNTIQITYENIKTGNLTISDFICISKLNENQFSSLIILITLADNKTEENTIKINLYNLIDLVNYKMNILNEINKFLSCYSSKINENSIEVLSQFILNIKEKSNKIKLSEFKFIKEIYDYKDFIIEINEWKETICFNNIFDISFTKENNQMGIESFIKISLESINLIKDKITFFIKSENFIELKFKEIYKLFNNLSDSEVEYKLITKLIQIENEKEEANLKSILKNMAEISKFSNFSSVMIKLDFNYEFNKSNKNLYKEYLNILQNDLDLDSVFNITNKIRKIREDFKYEIENILLEMSENKEMIDFIIAVPEEDIRNMIDAVDEHGDSFIRVQTIRDLINIGSFIRILDISISTKESNEEDFIKNIIRAIDTNPSFITIDVLINYCSKHYMGIKLLHGELSNREEASKVKVREIVNQSIFNFNLIKNSFIYELNVNYSQMLKKINLSDLTELRDRILLLNNNQKEVEENKSNKNSYDYFIKIVEISEKIIFNLNDLISNGYPINISRQFKLIEGDYNLFQIFLDEISELNIQWNLELKEAYLEYYPLTYYKGSQFWEIEKIFSNEMNKEQIQNSNGFYLLKYACPVITINTIENFKNLIDLKSPKERLFNLGKILLEIIDINKNGARIIKQDTNNKISLKVPTNKIIFSSPPQLKIYSHLISLHFTIENLMPSENQILYCLPSTNLNELISFLYRYVYCKVDRLFTLVRVENLPFEIQNFLVERLNKIMKMNNKIISNLSIICSDKNSYIFRQFNENCQFIHKIREIEILDESSIIKIINKLNLNVYVIRSNDTGAGKTHKIQKLCGYNPIQNSSHYINFPIMDCVNLENISERLFELNKIKTMKTIHMSIMGNINNYEALDYILFKYIFIGTFQNGNEVSFRKKDDPIFIEVANTFNNFLFNATTIFQLMPQTETIISKDSLKMIEIKSNNQDIYEIQLVCNYLYHYDGKSLNMIDIHPDKTWRNFKKEEVIYLLNKFFIKENSEVTFRQIWIFINLLATQLKMMTNNYYFSCENLKYIQDDSLKEIRTEILESLLIMTQEFTIRSVKSARESQKNNFNLIKMKSKSDINNPEFNREDLNNLESRMEEINSFSSVISWSKSNHLLIMFHNDGVCVTPVYRVINDVPNQVKNLIESQKGKLEDYQKMSHQVLLHKLLSIVGKSYDEHNFNNCQYMLTADNFLKMLLIIIRARANLPIILMGETGCGKTSLIRFLTKNIIQEDLEVINLHAGVKESFIIQRMNEIINKYVNNVWVFLDEINTCDSLGLITEMICQRTMKGSLLPENIIFISACNPYKISKDNSEVGLIKRRIEVNLVYRVHPLPDSLIDYIWDYGALTQTEELLYISNILSTMSGSLKSEAVGLVIESQSFIRSRNDSFSVSLRDVTRFKTLHEFFFKMILERSIEDNQNLKYTAKPYTSKKAVILSLMMCYSYRLDKLIDRNNYKKIIMKYLNINLKTLDEIVYEEQFDIISRMELTPAIAINKALLENVFTLLVCIINKIPIFICGKPGLSKSLSVQLLVSNLRGRDSTNSFFRKLPRVLAVPYQGSESSTSEGIERVFEKAINITKNENINSEILPILVFDEIGLAEISKNNPLKILHSLLEPENPQIAFVGLSNWRLDASKMNRAIYLARPDPDLEDLENTAEAMFNYYIKDPRFDEIDLMKYLAQTYFNFKNEQILSGQNEFHGTRDFYSLIKQVTKEFNKNYSNYNELKFSIIYDALLRNFGGLENSAEKIIKIFNNIAKIMPKLNSNRNSIDLIKNNLTDKDSRYLLLFTNGSSAEYILENYLRNYIKERIFLSGSQFENDIKQEKHSFKILSDIILYMESGSSIILKNLDQIYGALYDLFNQNFMVVGKKKNCRIALGSANNPMCFVNDNFHCVVLVDVNEIDKMDPPFLNRFEKQILTFNSILNERQRNLIQELNVWLDIIIEKNISDYIITYNKEEFIQSIILVNYKDDYNNQKILEMSKRSVISLAKQNFIIQSSMSTICRDELQKVYDIYFEEQSHNSIKEYLTNFKNNSKLIVYTHSNILEEIELINYDEVEYLNVGEIKSEKNFDFSLKNFINNLDKNWLLIKVDSIKESVHIPMIIFKINKLFNEYIHKNIALIIHSDPSNKIRLNSHFLSGWNHIMIENINGGDEEKLKNVINLSTLEIIESFVDKNIIMEIIFNIYMKFKYEVYNQEDNKNVKEHFKIVLEKLVSKVDEEMFNLIIKMATESLKNKELPDWKEKVCQSENLKLKSLNTYQKIKNVIAEVLEDPLSKIIYSIESESAFDSFYNEDFNVRLIWKEILNLKNPNEIIQYNSMIINPVFNLSFPFSKNNIYFISKGISEYLDNIYVIDNSCYFNQKMDEESKSNCTVQIELIENFIRNNCLLFKLQNNSEDLKYIEEIYIKDVICYFITVELKLESKFSNLIISLLKKILNFDINNLSYIFIFLYKNKNILDNLFKMILSFCQGDNPISEIDFIESQINKIITHNSNLFDNEKRRITEINIFIIIYNHFTKILLSHINMIKEIKEKTYSYVLNNIINSLMSFSLEIKDNLESLIILKILNEYLKFLSITTVRNDSYLNEISKFTSNLFIQDFNKINLKDFSFVKKMLDGIENKRENILEHKNNNKIDEIVTNTKISIFENVLLCKVEFLLKQTIINNILNDNQLIKYSSMILHRLFSEYKIEESFNQIENCELKIIFERILSNDDIFRLEHISFSFLSDFFRKYLTQPDDDKSESYLISNLDNFLKYLNFINSEEKPFLFILGISGIKHYLEVFTKHLSEVLNKNLTPNLYLLEEINKILENKGKYNFKSKDILDSIKNYVLKCLMRFSHNSAQGLSQINFEDLRINWINSKVFENNNNSLGLELVLTEMDKMNKEYSLFFTQLITDDKIEIIQKFKEIISQASEKSELKFIIIQFFINKVYISFSNKNFENSQTYEHIKKIFKIVSKDIKKYLGNSIHYFINNLIENFPNSYFNMKNENNSKIGGFAFLMQCYNLVLSYRGEVQFNLNKIFSNIKDFKNIFIPGGFVEFHDENLSVMIRDVDEQFSVYGTQIGLYECSCGYLYTIGNCTRPYVIFPCPMCNLDIGGTGHVLVERAGHVCLINADNRSEANLKEIVIDHLKEKMKNQPGYVSKMPDELGNDYTTRQLSQIGFRFFNLLTHGILLLMIENNEILSDDLQSILLGNNNTNIIDYLQRHVTSDLTKLNLLMNTNDYYIILIELLDSLFKLSKENYNMTFTTQFDRERLENLLQNKYINNIVKNMGGFIKEYRQKYSLEKNITYLSILDENFTEEQEKILPNIEWMRIMRATKLGTWNELKNEHMKSKNMNLFLKMVIDKIDEIKMLTNLYPLIEFTNYMIELLNFKLTRQEAKDKKIGDFLNLDSNPLHKKLWNNFERAWSNISYHATQYACKVLPRLDKVHLNLPVSFILLDDRELGFGMYMAAAFQYLGMIQNEVLEASVYLITSDSNYLSWSNIDHHRYPIQKISPNEIIFYQTDLDYINQITETYAKFYDIFNDKFGPEGKIIQFNFDKIESEFANKLVINKKILNYEDLNRIQYKFELLSMQNKNSNLINEIKNKFNQNNFEIEDYIKVRKCLENIEIINLHKLNQIFSSVEIILIQIKYSNKLDETETLSDFIENLSEVIKNNLSNELKVTKLICNIRLNNIVAFYQLIEEILFKYIVEYISPEFKLKLDENVQVKINEFLIISNNNSLTYPNYNHLIKNLQRFIIRCLVAFVEPNFPIKDYLMRTDLWDIEVKEEMIDSFYYEFPDEILIANTFSLLDCLIEFKKQQEEIDSTK